MRCSREARFLAAVASKRGSRLVALALAKPPYVLFGLLYIVAMVRQRGLTTKILGLAVATSAASAAGWDVWASRHYTQQYFALAQLGPGYYAFRGVDSTRQLTYITTAPWSFAAVVGRTILLSRSHFAHDIAMQSPAWHAPSWMAAIELVVLVGAASVAIDTCGISFVRASAAVTAVVTTVAVFVLAYAGWNRLRAPHIDALDGRYFFPILALGLLALTPVFGHRLPRGTRRAATRALVATQLVLVLVVGGMSVHDAYATRVRPLDATASHHAAINARRRASPR